MPDSGESAALQQIGVQIVISLFDQSKMERRKIEERHVRPEVVFQMIVEVDPVHEPFFQGRRNGGSYEWVCGERDYWESRRLVLGRRTEEIDELTDRE
jgi:hypothetical protein